MGCLLLCSLQTPQELFFRQLGGFSHSDTEKVGDVLELSSSNKTIETSAEGDTKRRDGLITVPTKKSKVKLDSSSKVRNSRFVQN